jgi:hypothetical protein
MDWAKSNQLLRRFYRDIRLAWLRSIRMVDDDRTRVDEAAERFAGQISANAIQAGYAEAKYLKTGIFDPTVSADRLRIGRMSLVTRFLSDVQRSLGQSAGLSERQAADLRTYRATLEGSSLDAIDRGTKPLHPRDIDRQVKAVQARMIQNRAALIARGQSTSAFHLGIQLAHEQAAAVNAMPPVNQTWITAADEKVRGSHSAMHGMVRPVGTPFITGNGYPIMRPHDGNAPSSETANCRCFLITARKES